MIIGVDIDGTIRLTDFILGDSTDSEKDWPDIEALRVLRELSNQHTIVYITSRSGRTRFRTVQWLLQVGFPNPHAVYFSNGNAKTSIIDELGVSVFIDDDPEFIVNALDGNAVPVLISRWYNAEFQNERVLRVHSWVEILDLIQKIEQNEQKTV